MGEIHELIVLALSLVGFAGATPDLDKLYGLGFCKQCPLPGMNTYMPGIHARSNMTSD